MFSVKKMIAIFGAFIVVACNETPSGSSYEVYEPTPLTEAQLESEAESFYLDNRYTFRNWTESLYEGNEFDKKEAQKDLEKLMFDLLLSDKYADGDANKIWSRALDMSSRDN
jgi:hypothetical protein